MNIKVIIENHGKWLLDNSQGCRANLRDADLYGADLRGANLRNADLRNANLRDANLRNADLYGANLRDANLRDANLRNANLRDADLRDADLYGANLWGANLPNQIIQVGPIGSRKSQTVYNVTKDVVQCGCWNNYRGGSLEEFEERVIQVYHNNPKYLKEYMGAIQYFKLLRGTNQ